MCDVCFWLVLLVFLLVVLLWLVLMLLVGFVFGLDEYWVYMDDILF